MSVFRTTLTVKNEACFCGFLIDLSTSLVNVPTCTLLFNKASNSKTVMLQTNFSETVFLISILGMSILSSVLSVNLKVMLQTNEQGTKAAIA